MAKRKPRLTVAIRTRIVQLRASNPDHPPSLDNILSTLADEGWSSLPSRGSVQKVVHWWDGLDFNIRSRDLPFEWQRLDRAHIPWEASKWVLSCKFLIDRFGKVKGTPESVKSLLEGWEPFSNRWATWCWRVHLAAPELPELAVVGIAAEYAFAEAATDFGFTSESGMQGIDAFLSWRPWESVNQAREYEKAVNDGHIPSIPLFNYDVNVQPNVSAMTGIPSKVGPVFYVLLSIYWRQWQYPPRKFNRRRKYERNH